MRLDNLTVRALESDETGVLSRVRTEVVGEYGRIWLRMDDDETEYLAGLLFDDRAFCMRAYYVLKDYIGHPVKELGDIEVD